MKRYASYFKFGVAGIKYFASHAAAFGGVAMALVLVCTGHFAEALSAIIGALAGFGVNLPPAKLVEAGVEPAPSPQ